jgi:signal transduction histidine kinase
MNDEQLNQRVNLLRKALIFKMGSDRELKELSKSLVERVVPKNEEIILKGTKGENLFIVVDGMVKIHDDDHVYNISGKGHVFGEYSLFHTEIRTATVTALETTHLLVLSQKNFKKLLSDNKEIQHAVSESLVETIAVQNRMEKELVIKNKLIAQQKDELQKTINIKNRFFSLIAHDLRSPLSSLSSYLNMLIDSNVLSKKEISEYAVDLKKSVSNVNGMLDNLLNWAVSETGDWNIKSSVFNIKNAVDRNVELYHTVAKQKSISLINRSKSVNIVADENSVDVVLRNLISNGIKYTHKGGEVEISVDDTDEYVVVSVKDNGIGISDEIKEKLYRLDGKHKPKGTDNEKGSGLGLILCKEFAEKNNGFLKFESELGKGTTFKFYLPKEGVIKQ